MVGCYGQSMFTLYGAVQPSLSGPDSVSIPPIRVGVAQYVSQGLSLYFSSCRYKLIARGFNVPLPDFAGVFIWWTSFEN